MYAHSWGMKNGFSDVTAQQKVLTFDNEKINYLKMGHADELCFAGGNH